MGVRYNTDSAKLIGTGNSIERDEASPERWEAGLYQRPQVKDFFLAGSGNSMTVFGGKERIIPISAKQARIWASWYLDKGTFEKATALTRRQPTRGS